MMALQYILFLLTLLAVYAAAENADAVWGWSSLTPAQGYVNTSFKVHNGTKVFAYIDETYDSSQIERAIIQMHGHGRDCWNYAKHTSDARDLAVDTMGLNPDTILSIAPEMFGVGDFNSGAFTLDDNYLCWSGDEWSGGYDNVEDCTPGVTGISAFTAIDSIVSWLQNTTRFPVLNTIVVSGHSLGGQFAHRYASLGSNRGNAKVEMSYWIGNPASYLYLNDARPSTKAALEACVDFDSYKYGMQNITELQSYAKQPNAAQIWATYITNNVHIALGLADDGSGDLGCEGLVQGQSHLDRGLGYMNFVQKWAGSLPDLHTIDYFPGIKHNAGKMLQQATSLRRLFFDRGSIIAPSNAPNGMTNGQVVKFISLDSTSSSVNFTNAPSTLSTLSSKVKPVKVKASSSSSNTSSAALPLSPSNANSSNGSFSLHLLLPVLLAVFASSVLFL